MKYSSSPPDDRDSSDTLSVYLALEKRVKALEDELAFTKLTIHALYQEIKAQGKTP